MPASQKRPNVLLFISHDAGRCVQPYGYETFSTPNFTELADSGVTVENSFCAFPVCSPARAAIVTGRYPHQNGVDGLVGHHRGFAFHAGEVHAATHFAQAGYESVLCGMMHESSDCTSLGFERFLAGPGNEYNDGGDLLEYGKAIGDWLAERDNGKPFYLQLGCGDAHRPWTKRNGPDDSLGTWQPAWLHDSDEVRQEMKEFQGSVKRLDQGLGGILQALDEAGVADDTIVVVTTDHGADVPMAKSTLRDPGLETYLFLRYTAGKWGQGRRLAEFVSQVDILPTVLEACSIAVPDAVTGRSFLPLLEGRDYRPRDAIFAEKSFADSYDPRRCVRTERWKYIRYFEMNSFCEMRSATWTRLHQSQVEWRRLVCEELYDLHADPEERHNLVDDPAHAEIREQLSQRLAGWMRRTNDPVLQGPMESPFYRAQRQELQRYADSPAWDGDDN